MSMNNPAQMANASLALQVGGVASQTFGSFFGAQAQKSTLGAQAAVAEVNARIAERGAQGELLRGQHEYGQLSLKAGQLKSSQRTAMAANGIDLGVGNAAEVVASGDLMKAEDLSTIEANAIKSAWGYRAQAMNYQNEATVSRARANGISPIMAASTTLLGGAAQVGQQWMAQRNAFGADQKSQAIAVANQSSDPLRSYGITQGWF